MNKQHTPGPWTIGKVSHKKQRVDIDSLHADQTVGHQTWRGPKNKNAHIQINPNQKTLNRQIKEK